MVLVLAQANSNSTLISRAGFSLSGSLPLRPGFEPGVEGRAIRRYSTSLFPIMQAAEGTQRKDNHIERRSRKDGVS